MDQGMIYLQSGIILFMHCSMSETQSEKIFIQIYEILRSLCACPDSEYSIEKFKICSSCLSTNFFCKCSKLTVRSPSGPGQIEKSERPSWELWVLIRKSRKCRRKLVKVNIVPAHEHRTTRWQERTVKWFKTITIHGDFPKFMYLFLSETCVLFRACCCERCFRNQLRWSRSMCRWIIFLHRT